MSVRTIHNKWWVDIRFERVRYRRKSPENSHAGARAYESLLMKRLSRGEPIDGKKQDEKEIPLFKDFSAHWFQMYVQTNNRASEQKRKYLTLRAHLIPFFGHLKLNEINAIRIEEYKSVKTKSGLAPKTINNHLTVLGKALRTAQEWIGLEVLPKITFLKVPPQGFDFLSPVESDKLLQSVTDPMWHAMVLVALRTGLRLGELAALDWTDVDLDRRLITVRRSLVNGVTGPPKNNRVRYVPLTEHVVEVLRRIQQPQGFVFWRKLHHSLNHKTPERAIRKFSGAAGVRHIGWHTLRHTFASQLTAAGVSMRIVQDLLGHSDLRTTMRYAHLAPSSLSDAVQLLESQKPPIIPSVWATGGQQGAQPNLAGERRA